MLELTLSKVSSFTAIAEGSFSGMLGCDGGLFDLALTRFLSSLDLKNHGFFLFLTIEDKKKLNFTTSLTFTLDVSKSIKYSFEFM